MTAAPHEYDLHRQITIELVFWLLSDLFGSAIMVENRATPVTIQGNNTINIESPILTPTGLTGTIFWSSARNSTQNNPMIMVEIWDAPASMMGRFRCFMVASRGFVIFSLCWFALYLMFVDSVVINNEPVGRFWKKIGIWWRIRSRDDALFVFSSAVHYQGSTTLI